MITWFIKRNKTIVILKEIKIMIIYQLIGIALNLMIRAYIKKYAYVSPESFFFYGFSRH